MFYYDEKENKAFKGKIFPKNEKWCHAKYLANNGDVIGENDIPTFFLDNCVGYRTFAELKAAHPQLAGAMQSKA